MKTAQLIEIGIGTLCSVAVVTFGQGPLVPPGPPAPMMKTLDQIKMARPIATAPFTIVQPGTYYLTTNLSVGAGDAITIATNDVVLDLLGFSIFSDSDPPSGCGICLQAGIRNVRILNGFISGQVTNAGGVFLGPGFNHGIFYSGAPPTNVHVFGVTVSGCKTNGIYLGPNATTVEQCLVDSIGAFGIVAGHVRECIATDCGGVGIGGLHVLDCYGSSVNGPWGLFAANAVGCIGKSAGGIGLAATNAVACCGYSVSNIGVYCTHRALGCYGVGTPQAVKSDRLAIACGGN